jgi:hypothetical protein
MTAFGDYVPETVLLSIGIMVAGIAIVVVASLAEHYSGKSNFVTRALNRWS